MKKLHILGAVTLLILALVAVLLLTSKESVAEPLIGEEVLITRFESGGRGTGKVLVQVPFVRSLQNGGDVRISVDQNADGSFGEGEAVVVDMPVIGRESWHSGYYANTDLEIVDGMSAEVLIEGTPHRATVKVHVVDVGELLDLETVTDPENATKGWGIEVAHAEEVVQNVVADVPDLNQRKGECAPTAAANSLISLVAKNGGEDLIPGDPQDFIENLKRHMNWTPENGVPPDDFVAGKNRWAAAAGVPIRTEKVGDTHGITTIDAIKDMLDDQHAVELRIKFADADLNPRGGHMVTVVGVHQGEGQTYLEINDPVTPNSGTEMVEIRNNQVVNYGPWQGITVLSWGFIQIWEGHPTGELLDTMTDEEIIGIRQFAGDEPTLTVIEYNGKYLPTSQLTVQDEEGCGGEHWHAARGGAVTATDGTLVADPGPQCGYGKLSEKPSRSIPAPNNND